MEQFEDKIQDTENRLLLTLEDVADIFDVPVNTVRDWANTGELYSLSIGPGLDLRFQVRDVMTFILQQSKGQLHVKS
jgi:hypothetical protein